MKEKLTSIPSGKLTAVIFLYIGSVSITVAGIIFSVLSFIEKISFTVMSAQVPGYVFGLVVTFLGVRYILSVGKLKNRVFNADSSFSWSNFRKN